MTLQQIKDTKRLSNTLRRLSAPILTILFAMLLTVVAWGQTLDKGTYTISNSVSHDNPVGQGMARSYTEETSDVEVNDNGTFVTLGFNNTQYMGDFTITVGGSKVTYETTTQANNIKKLKFKVPSLSSSIKVGLYVTPMDTTVEYTLTLNEGSLKLIKKAETEAPQSSTNSSASSTATNNSTSATTNSTGNSNAANSSASSATNSSTSANTNSAVSGTTNSNTGNKTNTTTNNTANSTSGAVADSNKTEAAEKTPASSETVKKADTETVQKAEEAVQKETENVEAVKETEAENSAEVNAEETNKENEQEGAQAEEKLEDQEQDEKQSEEEALADTTEAADENVETETATNSSSMKTIMLILGGIVVAGIIGFVIYSKRK